MIKRNSKISLLCSIALAILLTSCTTNILEGTFFAKQTFEGMLKTELDKPEVENPIIYKLSFPSAGKSIFLENEYNYYDCIILENAYPSFKRIIKDYIQAYLDDMPYKEQEELSKKIFKDIQTKTNPFILSTQELKKANINLENKKFNFQGYVGIGWHDDNNYMIAMLSTENFNQYYIFGE